MTGAGLVDVAIVGAGAAGLMAAIHAGRAAPGASVVLLDGARTIGAKILVAGGGRCNVTHDVVDERAYAGGTPAAIRKVLLQFDVPATVAFFRELGVTLKREEGGKLFPTTDRARTVLDALLRAVADAGVGLRHPFRVEAVAREPQGAFRLSGPAGTLAARTVVLATGGRSLPKSGSDGRGYELARALGHDLTPRVFPALVPLCLPPEHVLCALQGIAAPVRLEVRTPEGRRLHAVEGALLCTHFGVSGPAVLDVSRHLLDARADDPAATLHVAWLPEETPATLEASLRGLAGLQPATWLGRRLPARLARALCEQAGIDPAPARVDLTREQRRALVQLLTAMLLPVTGDRGWTYAEVTAGGVPLRQVDLRTMQSRRCPGLYLCGEILDVDGRIGGYNFQWAWASGHVAGCAVAAAVAAPRAT